MLFNNLLVNLKKSRDVLAKIRFLTQSLGHGRAPLWRVTVQFRHDFLHRWRRRIGGDRKIRLAKALKVFRLHHFPAAGSAKHDDGATADDRLDRRNARGKNDVVAWQNVLWLARQFIKWEPDTIEFQAALGGRGANQGNGFATGIMAAVKKKRALWLRWKFAHLRKARQVHGVEKHVDVLRWNIGLYRHPMSCRSRHRQIAIDPRVFYDRASPNRPVTMINGWHSRQSGQRRHRLQMMLSVDHVGQKRNIFQICRDGNQIIFQQPLALSRIAAVSDHRVSQAFEAAGQSADKGLCPSTSPQASTSNKNSHSATDFIIRKRPNLLDPGVAKIFPRQCRLGGYPVPFR